MSTEVLILVTEAISVYFFVLWAHSLRHHFGPIHFYALIGGLTAVMSWVTDAGMAVTAGGITFYVGSTVFYTSLLLAVFVIYVFDGPKITRVMISTIVGVSAMVPLIAMLLHMQNALISDIPLSNVPIPSLRINCASVFTTFIDLIFLAIVWEFLGKHNKFIHLGMRTFLTLLGVMWLDVMLFTSLAFGGKSGYLSIMTGTLLTRFAVAVLAFPMLYLYIRLQRRRKDVHMENRPVLSILKQIAEIEHELTEAQAEIQRRLIAEAELQKALSEVKTLKGMIPICAGCKSIRDDEGFWQRIEIYLRDQTDAEFSHGMCPDCQKKYYPDFYKQDPNSNGERASK
ncbi:hypothetical protein P3T73_04625 [Kiritimatiellota bacterium B12222]|nr:hypothetical protein P3T73_04625 [Kiritimatiellota bacterium B12222]